MAQSADSKSLAYLTEYNARNRSNVEGAVCRMMVPNEKLDDEDGRTCDWDKCFPSEMTSSKSLKSCFIRPETWYDSFVKFVVFSCDDRVLGLSMILFLVCGGRVSLDSVTDRGEDVAECFKGLGGGRSAFVVFLFLAASFSSRDATLG